MSDFLPSDYKEPKKPGSFMQFEVGDNRIRILAKPIMGFVGGSTSAMGKYKPVRKRMNEAFAPSEIDDPNNIVHFWAMPVWNYQLEKIQILEIKQKKIQRAIKSYYENKKWGSPLNYDFIINRQGLTKMDTEYEITVEPPTPLDEGIKRLFEDMRIDLSAMFRGEDPFNSKSYSAEEIADDVDGALG